MGLGGAGDGLEEGSSKGGGIERGRGRMERVRRRVIISSK